MGSAERRGLAARGRLAEPAPSQLGQPRRWGAKPFGELIGTGDLAWAHMKRVGKRAAGRELDGQIRDGFPRHLAGSGHAATGCTI